MVSLDNLLQRLRSHRISQESAVAILNRALLDAEARGREVGRREAAVACKMWGDERGVGRELYDFLANGK